MPTTPEAPPTPGPVTTAALGDNLSSFGPGYIDNAVPFSHIRLRVDAAYDSNRPDRAEFFYPQCGSPNSVQIVDRRVDYQDIRAYMEFAPKDWFSVFVDLPVRFLNPELNPNASGFADMNAGFKVALWQNDCTIFTFQGRVYIPTGDSRQGLGTDHVSLEPSLLFARSFGDRLNVYGQLGIWIPLGGTDFAGNVVDYGIGASYMVVDRCKLKVAPVVEMLGWTVLNGQETTGVGAGSPGSTQTPNPVDAGGDTIINAKLGVRVGFGCGWNSKLINNSDIYVGYGRALTGDVWYRDIVRLEYRLRF